MDHHTPFGAEDKAGFYAQGFVNPGKTLYFLCYILGPWLSCSYCRSQLHTLVMKPLYLKCIFLVSGFFF